MSKLLKDIKYQAKRFNNWVFEEDDPATVRCDVRSSESLLDSDNALADVAAIMDKNKNLKIKTNLDAQNAWQEYAKYSGLKFKKLKEKTLEFRKLCSTLGGELKSIDLNNYRAILEKSEKFKEQSRNLTKSNLELKGNIEFFKLEHKKANKELGLLQAELDTASVDIEETCKKQTEHNNKVLQVLKTLKDAKNLADIDERIRSLSELDGEGSVQVISEAQALKERLAELKDAGRIPAPQNNILSKEKLMDAYFSDRKNGLEKLINGTNELSDDQKKKMIEKIKEVKEANKNLESEIKELEKTKNGWFNRKKSNNPYTQAFKPWFSSRTYSDANNAINSAIESLQGNNLETGKIADLYKELDAKFLDIRTAETQNTPNADPLNGIDVENAFFSGTLMTQVNRIDSVGSSQKKEIEGKIKSTTTAWSTLKIKCESRNKDISRQQKILEEKKSAKGKGKAVQELKNKIGIVEAFVSLTENANNWKNNPPKFDDGKNAIKNYEKAYGLSGVLDKYQKICNAKINKVEISKQDKEAEDKRVKCIQELTRVHIPSEQVEDLRQEIQKEILEIIQKSKDVVSKGQTYFGKNTALQEINQLSTPEKAKKRLSEIITNAFVIAHCIAVLLENCLDSNNKLKKGAAGESLDWKKVETFQGLFDKYVITSKNYQQHLGKYNLQSIQKTRV